MNLEKFKKAIKQGIPSVLPPSKTRSDEVPHAPVRKEILTSAEKELALANALRYFPEDQHQVLAHEFAQELKNYGRILIIIMKNQKKILKIFLKFFLIKKIFSDVFNILMH